MNYKKIILEKIVNNKEVVGIIGLGKVGLPLALNFAEAPATPGQKLIYTLFFSASWRRKCQRKERGWTAKGGKGETFHTHSNKK